MIQTKVKYIKNIVQKNVGLLGQQLLRSVLIVEKKLSLVNRLIRNIATKSVETSITGRGLRDTTRHNGKVVKPRRISALGLLLPLESGVKRFINEITIPVRNVVEEVKKEIGLSYTRTMLNRYQSIQNLPLMLVTGRHCVPSVIGKQTLGAITNDPKYCDVIRKRYWKFINGSEEGWEDGTK